MNCARGKASPDEKTKRRLLADSGGYCQNPDCLSELFAENNGGFYHIAEIAHIVSVGQIGPRANNQLCPEEKGHYDNLLLLCPNCHTAIDKSPDDYPEELIKKWKNNHKKRLLKHLVIVKLSPEKMQEKQFSHC